MRNKLLFFGLILVLNFKAQYTITAGSNPIIGDVETYVYTYSTSLTPPAAGINILWNYSAITIDNTLGISSSTYIPISSVPNNNLFPGATLGADYGANSYGAFKINNATNEYLGYATPTLSSCSVYSDPFIYKQIPFSYGSTFADNYAYASNSYSVNATISATANGHGTLIIPGYTITNVLKITQTQTEIFLLSPGTSTQTTVQNFFYSAISKFPLFTVTTYTNSYSTTTVTSSGIIGAVNNSVNTNVGIKETVYDNGFSVFPNPANTEKVSINFYLKEVLPTTLTLINTLGEIIKEDTYNDLQPGKNKIDFGLKNIPKGIYYLQIITEDNTHVKKLIVE